MGIAQLIFNLSNTHVDIKNEANCKILKYSVFIEHMKICDNYYIILHNNKCLFVVIMLKNSVHVTAVSDTQR